MHHEPKIPEKATHSSSASQVAMQSCCLACPSRKSNTRFGLPGFPHFFPFLDASAITELCTSDASSTVKAFAAPSKRMHVNVVAVHTKRLNPVRRGVISTSRKKVVITSQSRSLFSRVHTRALLLRRAEMIIVGRCRREDVFMEES